MTVATNIAARRKSATDTPMLRVRGLKRYFDVSPPLLNRLLERRPRQVLKAVDGIDFDIGSGQTLALVGESGCGKSTVARCVVGLHAPTAGSVELAGVDVHDAPSRREAMIVRRRMQMVFQDPYASLNPRWRVFDIVAEPIRAFQVRQGAAAIRGRVHDLLAHVSLTAADGDKYPHEFSGGQRQRISIARALASNPEFLVCDEPTSALDVSVQAQILNLMKDLQSDLGLTYLFISHDLSVVFHTSDVVGVMYLGRLAELRQAKDLFARPAHPYTRLLLETIPDLKAIGRARSPLGGEVPSPIDPPSGCAFHPRCPFADERCRAERPEPLPLDGGVAACHAVQEDRLPAQ